MTVQTYIWRGPLLTLLKSWSPWSHSREITLCAKSLSSQRSYSKGTLKALSQPPKCLPWTVGLKLLSTAGALQQLHCQDCRHPAESRGFDYPAQAIIPVQLSLDTAGLSMSSASNSGQKWRGEGSQTKVPNFTSTCMRFEDHHSFLVLWCQVLTLEIFIDEGNNFHKKSPSFTTLRAKLHISRH